MPKNFNEIIDYNSLFSLIDDNMFAVILFNEDGEIEYVNKIFENITGFLGENIIGKPLSSISSNRFMKIFNEKARNFLKKSKKFIGEVENITSSNGTFWDSFVLLSLLKDKNKKKIYAKIFEDVSDQKKLVEVLLRSYNFLESVLNSSNPIFVIDESQIFSMVNRGFISTLKLKNADVIGKTFDEIFSKKSSDILKKMVANLSNSQNPIMQREIEVVTKNNLKLFLLINLESLHEKTGEKIIVGSFEDITKQKQNEFRLKSLSLAVDQSPASVVITDLDGNITYINPKFSRLTGYSFDEAIGKNPSILKSGYQSSDFYKEMWSTIVSGKDWHGEFNNKKKNGECYWEYASISPIKNSKNEIISYIAIKEDITDRKKYENALLLSEKNLKAKNVAMEKELEYAQVITKALLPKTAPKLDFLKIEYRFSPLNEVGGDYFAFYPFSKNWLGCFIGDVSGHGVAAALFLALVKSATEKILNDCKNNPANYLNNLNAELFSGMASYFMTSIYGLFFEEENFVRFKFAKGGHPAPILYRKKNKKAEGLFSNGKPVGIFEDIATENIEVLLESGDRLFLFTDGITEMVNKEQDMLELKGLISLIDNNYVEDLSENIDLLFEKLEEYTGTQENDDDILLIGFEVS